MALSLPDITNAVAALLDSPPRLVTRLDYSREWDLMLFQVYQNDRLIAEAKLPPEFLNLSMQEFSDRVLREVLPMRPAAGIGGPSLAF
jgi:hypothetical protein